MLWLNFGGKSREMLWEQKRSAWVWLETSFFLHIQSGTSSKWNTQEPNLKGTIKTAIKKGLWNILRAKLMWKIHNKQNIKIINKNKISIIIISLVSIAFSV